MERSWWLDAPVGYNLHSRKQLDYPPPKARASGPQNGAGLLFELPQSLLLGANSFRLALAFSSGPLTKGHSRSQSLPTSTDPCWTSTLGTVSSTRSRQE